MEPDTQTQEGRDEVAEAAREAMLWMTDDEVVAWVGAIMADEIAAWVGRQ